MPQVCRKFLQQMAVTTIVSAATGPALTPFPHVERTRSIRLIQSSTAGGEVNSSKVPRVDNATWAVPLARSGYGRVPGLCSGRTRSGRLSAKFDGANGCQKRRKYSPPIVRRRETFHVGR